MNETSETAAGSKKLAAVFSRTLRLLNVFDNFFIFFSKKLLTNEFFHDIIFSVIRRQQVPVKAQLSCRGEMN